MSFLNINHVRNILDACIDGDNFKLEELLKQNYTPSYNPPLPSYNPPSKLDENKQSEIDKNKQSEIDKIVKNIEKISIHNKCPYVLKKGKNKGKVCNVKSRNNNLYCSKHNK